MRLRRRCLLFAARRVGALLGLCLAWPVQASTPPLESAYLSGVAKATQDNDLAGALEQIDRTLAQHKAYKDARAQNPALAALYVLRAVLLYATDGESAKTQILAALESALGLHPWVDFEPSMRSPQLSALLQEARAKAKVSAPDASTLHHRGPTRCGEAFEISIAYDGQLGVAQARLHWRPKGALDYVDREIDRFSGVAMASVAPEEHLDRGGDYFVELLDAQGSTLAQVGTAASPQQVLLDCGQPALAPVSKADAKPLASSSVGSAMRKWGLRLSAGTGWGLAYGRGQFVYERANPNVKRHYAQSAAACAAARRASGPSGPLPSAQALHGGDATAPTEDSIFGRVGSSPLQAAELAMSYDPDRCAQRQNIKTGMASAHLHLAPELRYRWSQRFEASVFGRVQVLTGGNQLVPKDTQDLLAFEPDATRRVLPMPWALGGSFRYHLPLKHRVFRGPMLSKLDLFAGVFAGYGSAAVAVPMPFGQDSNGNSVSDELERACALDPVTPVFPFMTGCTVDAKATSAVEQLQERGEQGSKVVDTILLGSFFAGAELGAEYRFNPWLGLALSSQVGAWIGPRSTMLIDLNLGPAFHF